MENRISSPIVSLQTHRYLSFRYSIFKDALSKAAGSAIYMTMDMQSAVWEVDDFSEVSKALA